MVPRWCPTLDIVLATGKVWAWFTGMILTKWLNAWAWLSAPGMVLTGGKTPGRGFPHWEWFRQAVERSGVVFGT